MTLRIKRAIPGRLVAGRFIPNSKKGTVEEVLYRKFRKEGYSRSEAKRYAKVNAPFFGGAKNPKRRRNAGTMKPYPEAHRVGLHARGTQGIQSKAKALKEFEAWYDYRKNDLDHSFPKAEFKREFLRGWGAK